MQDFVHQQYGRCSPLVIGTEWPLPSRVPAASSGGKSSSWFLLIEALSRQRMSACYHTWVLPKMRGQISCCFMGPPMISQRPVGVLLRV